MTRLVRCKAACAAEWNLGGRQAMPDDAGGEEACLQPG